MTTSDRLRVAMVSPAADGTAISNYTRTIVDALARGCDVTWFCDGPGQAIENPSGWRVRRWPVAVEELASFDVVHLQVGNSRFHHFQLHGLDILAELKRRGTPILLTAHDARIGRMALRGCSACMAALRPRSARQTLAGVFRNLGLRRPLVDSAPLRVRTEQAWTALQPNVVVHADSARRLGWISAMRSVEVVHFPAMPGAHQVDPGGETIRFLCPGLTIFPRRGLRLVLRAFARLDGDVRLDVTGTATGVSRLEASICRAVGRRLERQGRLRWLGRISREEYLGLLGKAHVLLAPRLWSNGEVSATMMDALSFGKPVVASDIGAYPEYIHRDKSGLLTANTIAGWAGAMAKLVADPALRQKLGTEAWRSANAEFAPAAVAANLIQIYRRHLAQGGSGSSTME
jgi:glycosyltransferase involved in cell wall biosynthesis